ncbi:MAG: hypothetical protein ACTHNP_09200 [Solirubrobacterales bacterium]
MDAALIAAGTSLVISSSSTYWSWRQRRQERQIEAKAELARYRKPLLEAAQDLGARIDNIQHNNFDFYFQSDDRGEIAIKSTLYRFTRYFATLEILRSQLSFLEFESAEETKTVAAQIVQIEGALTTDSHAGFMLWREEQRAIGGAALARNEDGSLHCLGFADFVAEFDQRLSPWLARFQAELEEPGAAASSKRLEAVQHHLKDLVHQLDEEGRYDRPSQSPIWLSH